MYGSIVSSLPVHNSRFYRGGAPHYSDPEELGTYSLVGGEGAYAKGNVHGRYLLIPERPNDLHWDLDEGYADVVRLDRNQTPVMDTTLQWILDNKATFCNAIDGMNPSKGITSDGGAPRAFVVRRGALHSAFCTPYDIRSDWMIAATRHQGVVYLKAFDTEAWKAQCRDRENNSFQDHATFWGHNFEQHITSEKPGMPAATGAPVVERESLQAVARSRLGKHNIIICGEVDAIDNAVRDERSMAKYVELKTRIIPKEERQEKNFRRYKLWNWWSQSYLMGLKRVICGFRDHNGVVRYLKEFNVDTIPEECEKEGLWCRADGLNFCYQFLSFVESNLGKDNSRVVYLFTYEPQKREVTCKLLPEPGEYQVLPEWFLKQF